MGSGSLNLNGWNSPGSWTIFQEISFLRYTRRWCRSCRFFWNLISYNDIEKPSSKIMFSATVFIWDAKIFMDSVRSVTYSFLPFSCKNIKLFTDLIWQVMDFQPGEYLNVKVSISYIMQLSFRITRNPFVLHFVPASTSWS